MEYFCSVCPRRCHAWRGETTGVGFCGMPADPVIARAALHFGEEPCITGTNGSGTVFFSGCTLRCRFCQNEPISQKNYGKTVSAERLADIFKELEQAGAHNINLVNPTHFIPAIQKALERYRPSVPVIYNTGGYERVESIRSLEGYIDGYLPDYKYIHPETAKDLSGAEDYPARAWEAILEMARQTGPVTLDENGLLRKGTIVRHLVLPGHTNESIAVLTKSAEYKHLFWMSVMFQYTPMGNLDGHPELQRKLTRRECRKIEDALARLDITDGYIQSSDSSGPMMIPSFDLTGVEPLTSK